MSRKDRKIIVVRKRGGGHAAHHGGSWKVAFADFTLSMMAFFLVMWVLGMDESAKRSIEGYFANPVGYKKGAGAGQSPIALGNTPVRMPPQAVRTIARQQELRKFESVRRDIILKLEGGGLKEISALVQIVVTRTGLRIELGESADGQLFFPLGSAVMRPLMQQVLEVVADQIIPLPNGVVLEGHTDAAAYRDARVGGYSNWELSGDRANAARRVLESRGLDPARLIEVHGLADRQLKLPDLPLDPRNRRITVFLPFRTPAPDVDSTRALLPGGVQLPSPGAPPGLGSAGVGSVDGDAGPVSGDGPIGAASG